MTLESLRTDDKLPIILEYSLTEILNTMDMNLSKLQEIVKDWEAWHAAVQESQMAGHNLASEQQQ